MSKTKNNETVQGTESQLPTVANFNVVTDQAQLLDVRTIFESEDGFREVTEQFLNAEFLESAKGMELASVMLRKVVKEMTDKATNKKEMKEFIELALMTDEGVRTVFAGQHKFLAVFNENDKGNGVACFFTFLGKVNIKGTPKDVNEFKMRVKAL